MTCKKSIRRIEEICEELMELIDDSRALGENDECELICCVVHDSVQKMQRAVARWRPEEPINLNTNLSETGDERGRSIN